MAGHVHAMQVMASHVMHKASSLSECLTHQAQGPPMGAALPRGPAYLDTPGRPLEKGAPPRPGDMNDWVA